MRLEFVLSRADITALVACIHFANLMKRFDVTVKGRLVSKDYLTIGAFKMLTRQIKIVEAIDEKLVRTRGAK